MAKVSNMKRIKKKSPQSSTRKVGIRRLKPTLSGAALKKAIVPITQTSTPKTSAHYYQRVMTEMPKGPQGAEKWEAIAMYYQGLAMRHRAAALDALSKYLEAREKVTTQQKDIDTMTKYAGMQFTNHMDTTSTSSSSGIGRSKKARTKKYTKKFTTSSTPPSNYKPDSYVVGTQTWKRKKDGSGFYLKK